MFSQKLTLLILLCLSTFLLSAQDDIEVPEKQIPLVTKISASWCPHCGSWGWDFMESVEGENSEVANLFTAHYSGDYKIDAAAEITSNLGAVGQPNWFINSQRVSVTSSNADSKKSEFKIAINQNATIDPIVQTGMKVGTFEGQFNIITKNKFFQEAEGEYFLGLYLLEESFTGNQSGRGSDAEHKNLLRMSLTEGAFGETIGSGMMAVGSEALLNKSIAISEIPYDLDNVTILSIIWKKNDEKYVVVNSNSTSEIISGLEIETTTTRTRDLGKADFNAVIQPNVVLDVAQLNIDLPSARQNFAIELWSIDGKKVKNIFQGRINAGAHTWTIDRSQVTAAGIYLVRLNDGVGQLTKRVVFK